MFSHYLSVAHMNFFKGKNGNTLPSQISHYYYKMLAAAPVAEQSGD